MKGLDSALEMRLRLAYPSRLCFCMMVDENLLKIIIDFWTFLLAEQKR